jgi:hypothetical protein
MSDQHRFIINRKGAGGLAGSRTNTAGNFREIVGRMKAVTSLLPAILINQLIHVGYAIIQWTTCAMAKRYSAIHAPGCLLLDLIGR